MPVPPCVHLHSSSLSLYTVVATCHCYAFMPPAASCLFTLVPTARVDLTARLRSWQAFTGHFAERQGRRDRMHVWTDSDALGSIPASSGSRLLSCACRAAVNYATHFTPFCGRNGNAPPATSTYHNLHFYPVNDISGQRGAYHSLLHLYVTSKTENMPQRVPLPGTLPPPHTTYHTWNSSFARTG